MRGERRGVRERGRETVITESCVTTTQRKMRRKGAVVN